MTGSANQTDYVRQERQDRLILELEHDPYHSKRKVKGPAVCPDCGAVYIRGRWTWEAAATNARDHICPACHRISDRVPAAFLMIRGEFLQLHKDEIMNLVPNYEARERQDRPLKRIMDAFGWKAKWMSAVNLSLNSPATWPNASASSAHPHKICSARTTTPRWPRFSATASALA